MRAKCAAVLAAGLGLLLAARAEGTDKKLIEKIKREYCVFPEDDPGGKDWFARLEGVKAMGEPGRLALLKLVKSDETGECARLLLAELRDVRLIPTLRLTVADKREKPFKRAEALGYLGVLQDHESLPVMLEFLNSGDDAFISVAIAALAHVDEDSARQALRQAAVDPAFARYVVWIVRSIGAQRDHNAVDVLTTMTSRVADEYRRPAERLRSDVTLALVRIGSSEALARVRGVLEQIRDVEVRADTLRDVLLLLEEEKAGKAPAEVERFDEVIRQVKSLQAKPESR